MQFSTNCVTQLSALFTTLKRFGDFGEPIHFQQTGILYTALIEHGGGVVEWKLTRDDKNRYFCNIPYQVMPDIEMLSQSLNTKGWENVTWTLTGQNPETLNIRLIDNVHSRECSVPLLELEFKTNQAAACLQENIHWQWPDFVLLPSDKLKKMVTELNNLGADAVEIEYFPSRHLMIGGRSIQKHTKDVYVPNEVIKFVGTSCSQTATKSAYSLKTLLPIVKISKAVKDVKVYPALHLDLLNTPPPLLLEYELDGVGRVRFYIAPRAVEN